MIRSVHFTNSGELIMALNPALSVFEHHKQPKLVTLSNGWALALVDITPGLAEKMLGRNLENQRNLKEPTIVKYVADMLAGHWKLTHQGIAFDSDGSLYDGQHRLTAIVRSGVTVPMIVFFGAGGQSQMKVIDTHKVRTVVDAAKISEIDVRSSHVTTANSMIRYGYPNGHYIATHMTHTAKLEFLQKHAETIAKVDQWFGSGIVAKKVGVAPVKSAVVCAAYYVEHDKLARFVTVLTEHDDAQPGERIAKHLRQMITAMSGSSNYTGRELFLKTCKAIQCFVEGETPTRLVSCTENPFPFQL